MNLNEEHQRDLRYNFPQIEAWLNKAEEIVVHKRRKLIASLPLVRPKTEAYAESSALRRRIFGARRLANLGPILSLRSGRAA